MGVGSEFVQGTLSVSSFNSRVAFPPLLPYLQTDFSPFRLVYLFAFLYLPFLSPQYRTFDWEDILANLSPLLLTIPFSLWFWRNRGDSYDRLSGGGRDIWDARDEEDVERAEEEEEEELLHERNR